VARRDMWIRETWAGDAAGRRRDGRHRSDNHGGR
jgi:hypothetical protein